MSLSSLSKSLVRAHRSKPPIAGALGSPHSVEACWNCLGSLMNVPRTLIVESPPRRRRQMETLHRRRRRKSSRQRGMLKVLHDNEGMEVPMFSRAARSKVLMFSGAIGSPCGIEAQWEVVQVGRTSLCEPVTVGRHSRSCCWEPNPIIV